ncbi:hypothetical protein ACFSTC_43510 [Nonomuraea ferruginea]
MAAMAVGGVGYALTAGSGETGTPTQQSRQAGPEQGAGETGSEGEPLQDEAAADEATMGDADTGLPEEEAAEMGDASVGDTSGDTSGDTRDTRSRLVGQEHREQGRRRQAGNRREAGRQRQEAHDRGQAAALRRGRQPGGRPGQHRRRPVRQERLLTPRARWRGTRPFTLRTHPAPSEKPEVACRFSRALDLQPPAPPSYGSGHDH